MENFLNFVLGTTDVPTYLAGLLFALIGVIFYFKGKVKNRDKHSANTPYKFSWLFFTQDNIADIIVSLLGIFLVLRFSVEYAGVQVTMFYSFLIGLGLPKTIAKLYEFQAKAQK